MLPKSMLAVLAFLLTFIQLVSAEYYGDVGYGVGGGVGGLIVLILDVWAIIKILQSSRDAFGKFLWILLILFFPLGGFIAWLLCGRESAAVN